MTGSCADLNDGYYPVVTDCTTYMWCYTGGEAIQSCGTGTVFIPDIQRCGNPTACSVNVLRKAPIQGNALITRYHAYISRFEHKLNKINPST